VSNSSNSLQKLVDVMDKLLAEGGCPWDREQTHKSLAPYAIEEAHELVEAIEAQDWSGMKEELGDFLFQTVFHSALAQREGKFNLDDVVNTVAEKLIRRHPHVYSTTQVKNTEEVWKNWDAIKKEEKIKSGKEKKVFDIPVSLPALQRAQKIGDKTKNLKFDWNNPKEVFVKVREEMRELEEAFESGSLPHIQEEMGDLFFVLAQLARQMKFDAETIARAANKKFEMRFDKLLALAAERNLDFEKISMEQKEELWEAIKKS
jgi:tetrapyrrole methylase family protein/MazG family protein